MKTFKDKVAVVTGGNSGIGYATAKLLTAEGAKVIITGRRKEALEEAAKEIGAFPYLADQSKVQDIENLTNEVQSHFGQVDILFINAGITGDNTLIEEATEQNFDDVMNINLKGTYFTLSRFIPLLKEGASVILLSSNVASTNHPKSSVYQASKAAVNSIAKTAAAELAPRRIRVNSVSPGPTRTNVLDKSYDTITAQGIWNSLADRIPLKKIGTPEDVAQMVLYLSGETASFITGSDFVIDGGILL
ncbi:SDR family NAD(P)-dependent oxidoreductase [Flavobacterium sp. NRK1]|uniref:SDR family NAD(P)-dependent oxidoreductase n=1 Tax=Flavobacterium sp. NRK1 TaxID=2954929 RepID=UPI002093535F|nr:glucose 1-dehydrogenase [Flavobacterium sp. NRK1]MCO6148651.1 glucose 1-dehydrogenase [Flavobacterium sp. NRK1]